MDVSPARIGTPPISGLRFRKQRGKPDDSPMVAVYNACANADDLDQVITEADLSAFRENPVNADPDLDSLVVEIAGQVVGYSWMSHRLEDTGAEVHQHRGYVHPAWRRRGIGRALVERFWMRAAAVRLADSADAQRLLQTYLYEGEPSARALMTGLGYDPVRTFTHMLRSLAGPIPTFPLPQGVEIRPAGPQDRRPVWEAQREAFRDAWGYSPWTEDHYRRFTSFPHYDPDLWCVAWQGGRVVGSVLNYINYDENQRLRRQRGYTEDIAVARDWRGRGLASALIALSLERLRALGMTEAALVADSESPTGAQRLYRRLGYRSESRITMFRRQLPGADPLASGRRAHV